MILVSIRTLHIMWITALSFLVGLVGSLRLLCSLSSVTSEWRDPAILGALVSRLPRTLTPHLQQVTFFII